jgi:hypothetical protein
MPLRKSPVRTPALLAANRANAVKSTGPRTPQGKARVSFNSFKHGRYAARPEVLAERLLRAGRVREAALYRQVRWQISHAFRPTARPTGTASTGFRPGFGASGRVCGNWDQSQNVLCFHAGRR